eukprot:6486792-Amphidinium_carterae.3
MNLIDEHTVIAKLQERVLQGQLYSLQELQSVQRQSYMPLVYNSQHVVYVRNILQELNFADSKLLTPTIRVLGLFGLSCSAVDQ